MKVRRPVKTKPSAAKGAPGEGGREVLTVRVTPRAPADRLLEFREQAAVGATGRPARTTAQVLLAQVTAPPEGGKANTALVALLARTAGVPRGTVEVVAGSRSRTKLVRVPAGTGARLRRLLAG